VAKQDRRIHHRGAEARRRIQRRWDVSTEPTGRGFSFSDSLCLCGESYLLA
jgi:hypothetical protein